jgi:hypothetical protein
LTQDNQAYHRVCGKGNYYYETIQVKVYQAGSYGFNSNSSIAIYGYLYKNDFNPFNPDENRITESNFSCNGFQFYLAAHLQMNITYVLVVTTLDPNVQGEFSVIVNGRNNVDLNRTGKFLSFFYIINVELFFAQLNPIVIVSLEIDVIIIRKRSA